MPFFSSPLESPGFCESRSHCISARAMRVSAGFRRNVILDSHKLRSLPMRLGCMIFSFALAASAQVIPFDPEYVIPKENPYASPADLKNGQQLFMGQCARCHGPKGEEAGARF